MVVAPTTPLSLRKPRKLPLVSVLTCLRNIGPPPRRVPMLWRTQTPRSLCIAGEAGGLSACWTWVKSTRMSGSVSGVSRISQGTAEFNPRLPYATPNAEVLWTLALGGGEQRQS